MSCCRRRRCFRRRPERGLVLLGPWTGRNQCRRRSRRAVRQRSNPFARRSWQASSASSRLVTCRATGAQLRHPGRARGPIGVPCERLRAARYAVFCWSAAELDFPHAELTVQAVAELVRDLNRTTRAAALPLAGRRRPNRQPVAPGRPAIPCAAPGHGRSTTSPRSTDTRRCLSGANATCCFGSSRSPPPLASGRRFPHTGPGPPGDPAGARARGLSPRGPARNRPPGSLVPQPRFCPLPLGQARRGRPPSVAQVVRQMTARWGRHNSECRLSADQARRRPAVRPGQRGRRRGPRSLCPRRGHPRRPAPRETPVRTYDLRGKLVMAGAIDLHTHIGGGKVNIARTMLPDDQRAHVVPHRAYPLGRRPCGALHPCRRLPLCGDGLYDGLRARGPPGQCAPGPPRDGRHADPGHGRLCHARQRRFPPPADGGGGRPGGHQRLCRLDPARHPLHRHQGGQPGRDQRLQVQRPHDATRRAASALRRDAPGHLADPEPRRARAGRPPPAPCACSNLGVPGNVETSSPPWARPRACRST